MHSKISASSFRISWHGSLFSTWVNMFSTWYDDTQIRTKLLNSWAQSLSQVLKSESAPNWKYLLTCIHSVFLQAEVQNHISHSKVSTNSETSRIRHALKVKKSTLWRNYSNGSNCPLKSLDTVLGHYKLQITVGEKHIFTDTFSIDFS